MLFRSAAVAVVLSVAVARPFEPRAQCAHTLATAYTDAKNLVNHYYQSSSGQFNGGELWTDANAVEDIYNFVLAMPSATDFANVAKTSTTGKLALKPGSAQDWENLINGSIDDAQWIILALWKMADYYGSTGQNNAPFMNAAMIIYNNIVAPQWDTSVCGGGIWWSSARTYKNAVTNELFLLTSSECYRRTGTQSCLTYAKNVWNWLSHTNMRNSQGLYNDGLSSNCQNNGQTTWTYNQGVIASGLASLYVTTGSTNTTLLDQAEITLDATIAHLTQNGILKESCDNAAATSSPSCDNDQLIFKGIWTKHLQYYLDLANDPKRTAKYSSFLGAQSSAVYYYGTNANGDIGNVWYAPSQGGSIFKPQSSASGLAALNAAAKYGPC